MEHPPKQGLKHWSYCSGAKKLRGFNGTSTKTRIETISRKLDRFDRLLVLMEHPPKQGLKPQRYSC